MRDIRSRISKLEAAGGAGAVADYSHLTERQVCTRIIELCDRRFAHGTAAPDSPDLSDEAVRLDQRITQLLLKDGRMLGVDVDAISLTELWWDHLRPDLAARVAAMEI